MTTARTPARRVRVLPQVVRDTYLGLVVITGFNTDIEHNGTIYHVQTEDKGLNAPIILSLIYVGGAILASKRSPYDDLIAAGFDQHALAERLQRQHKLICAAISAGRIEDLKRLQQREPEIVAHAEGATPPAPPADAQEAPPAVADGQVFDVAPDAEPEMIAAIEPGADGKPAAEPVEPEFLHAEPEQAIHLSLLEEREFHAGEVVTIRVRVSRGPVDERVGVQSADVTVKILGSEFRPMILRSKTDADGVAVMHAWLPRFTSGRAAVLIRAVADDCTAELRRIIHH